MAGRRGVSPTVRRRRLGAELRRYREATGMTIDQVAERMECSASKISRLENGQTGSSPRDVRDILALYQVGEAETEELLDLARETRQRGWWQQHGAVLTSAFIGFEAAADVHPLVRGAMRARPVADRGLRPPAHRGWRATTARTRSRIAFGCGWQRQRLLTQDDPLDFWCVLDEAVLLRPVGGRWRHAEATRTPSRSVVIGQCHAAGASVGDRCACRHGWIVRLAALSRTREIRTRCTSPWPLEAFFRRSPMNCAATCAIFDRLTGCRSDPRRFKGAHPQVD